MSRPLRLSILIPVLFVYSCSTKHQQTDQVEPPDSSLSETVSVPDTTSLTPVVIPLQDSIYKDRVLDHTARFIAGLPQEDSSSISEWESDPYWKEYQTSMDSNWNKMYRERLQKMKSWQMESFSPSINDTLPVFYPFSGPDFLHAYYLYPNAMEYVLAALEPIVEIPVMDSLSTVDRDKFLDSLGNSLRDIFQKSYFITTHMTKDLKQIKGVLPPLFFFLERSGHEVLDLKFMTLDSAGFEKEVEVRKLHWQKTPGVKITFRNREDRVIKHLYYFGISISNQGIADRPAFQKFIKRKGPFNTFVKSASYLMHNPLFTSIKQLVLSNSNTLFQDDTGIPYRDLKNQLNISLQLYGDYATPVKDFGEAKFQPDLDSAYKANKNREALPFSLGYHWRGKKQNYMLARKQRLATSK